MLISQIRARAWANLAVISGSNPNRSLVRTSRFITGARTAL
jgi:hypothetical protein